MRNWWENNFLFLTLNTLYFILHITRYGSLQGSQWCLHVHFFVLIYLFNTWSYCSLYRKVLLVWCSMTSWKIPGSFHLWKPFQFQIFHVLVVCKSWLWLQFCGCDWQRKAGTFCNIIWWWELSKSGSGKGLRALSIVWEAK